MTFFLWLFILISQSSVLATQILVTRIPVFTSNDVPFDNGERPRALQPYFLAICDAFKKAGHKFKADSPDFPREEMKEVDAVIIFDLWGFYNDLARINQFPYERRI